MREFVNFDTGIPIWRLYIDYKHQIPKEFRYKGVDYTDGITIIHYGWIVGILLDRFVNYINSCPNPILCVNTETEYGLISRNISRFKQGFRFVLANNNAFIDESIYKIVDSEKSYDLVVNSSFCSYKRVYLSKNISNVIHIGYAQDNNPVIPNWGTLANYDGDVCKENFKFLHPSEIVKIYGTARVGGIFSQAEGACAASSEYLLCGLPVLSTHCRGGREIWYTKNNSVICNPDVDSVEKGLKLALDKISSGEFNSEKIRSEYIVLMNQHRDNLISAVTGLFYSLNLDIPSKELLASILNVYQLAKSDEIVKQYEGQKIAQEILSSL